MCFLHLKRKPTDSIYTGINPSLALIFGMAQTKNSNFTFIREEAFSRHVKIWNYLIGWNVQFSP